jgi:sulfatase modifying factor 1
MALFRNFILFAFVTVLFSFSEKPADYSKVLPGVVKVNDYLYYDKTEATNLWWREYLYWTKNEYGADSPQYLSIFPDTNVWRSSMSYNEPYVKYYLNHEAYKDYPVVGITWKQASEFCAWRTERVRENLTEQGKIDRAPAYFTYRLPTYEEWMLMYDDVSKLTFLICDEGKRKYQGMARFNMKRGQGDNMGVAGKLNDNADVTAPAESYWPNQYGVYNIKGNVSEWLLDKNTYVGGAWNTRIDEDVTTKLKLTEASASVGFRCVCEVAEEAP